KREKLDKIGQLSHRRGRASSLPAHLYPARYRLHSRTRHEHFFAFRPLQFPFHPSGDSSFRSNTQSLPDPQLSCTGPTEVFRIIRSLNLPGFSTRLAEENALMALSTASCQWLASS